MLLKLFLLIFFTTFIPNASSIYQKWILNSQQINQIRKWIYNNQLSLEQRQKINNVLIESHYSLAHKQAFIFKNKHKYKCRNIQINDLKSASELGLIKASQKYNGNSSFYYYSCLHIHYELLNLLTNHNKISQISRKNLRNGFSKKTQNFNTSFFCYLQNKLNIIYVTPISQQFIQIYKYTNHDKQLWYNVFSCLDDPIMKEIFILKYDINLKKIRNDKEISLLLGYSISFIRLKIKLMKKVIYKKIFI